MNMIYPKRKQNYLFKENKIPVCDGKESDNDVVFSASPDPFLKALMSTYKFSLQNPLGSSYIFYNTSWEKFLKEEEFILDDHISGGQTQGRGHVAAAT